MRPVAQLVEQPLYRRGSWMFESSRGDKPINNNQKPVAMSILKKRKTNHPPQIEKRKVNGRRKRALEYLEQRIEHPLTENQMTEEGKRKMQKEAEVLRGRIR